MEYLTKGDDHEESSSHRVSSYGICGVHVQRVQQEAGPADAGKEGQGAGEGKEVYAAGEIGDQDVPGTAHNGSPREIRHNAAFDAGDSNPHYAAGETGNSSPDNGEACHTATG